MLRGCQAGASRSWRLLGCGTVVVKITDQWGGSVFEAFVQCEIEGGEVTLCAPMLKPRSSADLSNVQSQSRDMLRQEQTFMVVPLVLYSGVSINNS